MPNFNIIYIGGPLGGRKDTVDRLHRIISAIGLATPRNKKGGMAKYQLLDSPHKNLPIYRYKFIAPKGK